MLQSLLNVLSLVLIIVLGWWLQRIRLFPKSARKSISKIMVAVTLPGAVVYAFAGAKLDPSAGLFALFGLVAAATPMFLSLALSKGLSKPLRIYSTITVAGFNIGCFTLPFILGAFGPAGAAVAIMFDSGNSLVVTGGSFAVATALFGTKVRKRDVGKAIVMELRKSIPFITSLVMFVWVMTGIPIPNALLTLARPIAAANSFIAMLLLGLMFKADLSPVKLRSAALVILLRLASGAAAAALVYFCLPYSREVRLVLAVSLFSPVTSVAPIYTDRAGGDSGLSSFTGSVSIVVSIVIVTVMLLGA